MPDTSPNRARSPWWKHFNESYNSYSVPDPWIRRKFVVLLVLALAVWSAYVSIGRTFVPGIQRRPGAAYSRGVGIGLLVVFLILYIMFIWSYLAFVPETEDPSWQAAYFPHPQGAPMSEATWQRGKGIQDIPSRPNELPDLFQGQQPMPLPPPPAVPAGHELPMTFSGGSADLMSFGGRASQAMAIYPSSAPPPAPAVETVHPMAPAPAHTDAQPSSMTPKAKTSRVPRPTPSVSSAPRWCAHCKIIKPDRTHHCRHCGTCILQFDHHCVWIGQCVGWGNHAVFITFCFWAGLFCLFSTAVLVVDSCLVFEVDGQKIAMITIAGILFLFTLLMMLPTHIYLILVGRSTIESFQTGTQQRAEEAVLKFEFDNPVCPTEDVRAVRKQWKEEYGGVAVNDRWRVGRARDRWRREMGKSPVGWVLPIGRPLGDGIHYEQNPRFGPNGEWLPMHQWPPDVAQK